jgi:hypothetical protein
MVISKKLITIVFYSVSGEKDEAVEKNKFVNYAGKSGRRNPDSYRD